MAFIELNTPDQLEYAFYPVSNGQFNFKVRAANDAHIALTTGPNQSDPMIEIFIGGWGNAKSVIRKNRTKPEKAEANTPNVLNAGEFRGFWIRWNNGVYTVGSEGDNSPFLSYQDDQTIPISFAGVCTGWGATGSWLIQAAQSPQSAPQFGGWSAPPSGGGGYTSWVPAANGQVPAGAQPHGEDANGEPIFVARARHAGALIPGKLVQSHGVAYVPWGGVENAYAEYEILVGGGQWVPAQGANIPPNAFPGGESEEGEPLFVGRARHEGSVTVGKVQPSHGVVYIPFGGAEIPYDSYEILVN